MTPRELELNSKIMLDSWRARLSVGKVNQVGDWVGIAWQVANHLQNKGQVKLHSPVKWEKGFCYTVEICNL